MNKQVKVGKMWVLRRFGVEKKESTNGVEKRPNAGNKVTVGEKLNTDRQAEHDT